MTFLDNLNAVIWWIGLLALVCSALALVIAMFTTPHPMHDDDAHRDTTGYGRSGKEWRP